MKDLLRRVQKVFACCEEVRAEGERARFHVEQQFGREDRWREWWGLAQLIQIELVPIVHDAVTLDMSI